MVEGPQKSHAEQKHEKEHLCRHIGKGEMCQGAGGTKLLSHAHKAIQLLSKFHNMTFWSLVQYGVLDFGVTAGSPVWFEYCIHSVFSMGAGFSVTRKSLREGHWCAGDCASCASSNLCGVWVTSLWLHTGHGQV